MGPMRIERLTKCSNVSCYHKVPAGTTYCEKHRKEAYKNYDRTRTDKMYHSFYKTSRWQQLRLLVLKREPLCRMCKANDMLTAAEMIDHIVPIKLDWSMRLREDNLQPLCHACHRVKTAEDVRKYGEC